MSLFSSTTGGAGRLLALLALYALAMGSLAVSASENWVIGFDKCKEFDEASDASMALCTQRPSWNGFVSVTPDPAACEAVANIYGYDATHICPAGESCEFHKDYCVIKLFKGHSESTVVTIPVPEMKTFVKTWANKCFAASAKGKYNGVKCTLPDGMVWALFSDEIEHTRERTRGRLVRKYTDSQ